jgi:hypothetical protein
MAVRRTDDGSLVVAICRSLRVDVVRFLHAAPTGFGEAKESVEVWLAEGSAFLRTGTEVRFGEPPAGLATQFLQPDALDAEIYSEGTFIVSLEDYTADGSLEDGLSMTFPVSALSENWLRGDGSTHNTACP